MRKRNRTKTIVVLLILLLCMTVSGCEVRKAKAADQESLSVDPEYFMLCCENTSTEIDFTNSSLTTLPVEIISAFPISSADKISISFNEDVLFSAELAFEDSTEGKPDQVSVMTWKNADWTRLAKRVKNCVTDEEISELLNREGFFDTPCDQNAPALYSNVILITFEKPEHDVEINELTITIGTTTKKYNIGSIQLTRGEEMNIDTRLFMSEFALIDIPMNPGHAGAVGQIQLNADMQENLVLSDIETTDDRICLTDVTIERVLESGEVSSEAWDNAQPVQFKQGEKVRFLVEFTVGDAKDAMTANGQFMLKFNYSVSDETLMIPVEISYRERFANPFHVYLQNECGKNAAAYWIDFLDALDGRIFVA